MRQPPFSFLRGQLTRRFCSLSRCHVTFMTLSRQHFRGPPQPPGRQRSYPIPVRCSCAGAFVLVLQPFRRPLLPTCCYYWFLEHYPDDGALQACLWTQRHNSVLLISFHSSTGAIGIVNLEPLAVGKDSALRATFGESVHLSRESMGAAIDS